ncbi:MAG: hypothetical protein A7316_00510 [Candidatus Altiarchaeales archaeon WOR_SM1_86-2]|nr:MAG: hypothetical protein A7315_13845 [Candidatus Altiarchaeales archaeon WOR_SM1_79]ODS39118.1 MAG: hypothetical protein A7316_00510 [Candidatus Altiarchaeales archaeon WOR_SM1_86-2]
MLSGFVEKYGLMYSEMLGINLKSKDEGEILKWFLAAILYAMPIREISAEKTYRCFSRHGILTPEEILDAGWDRLVEILDEGGYTRYDFKTADKLLEVFGNLQRFYDGSLSKLHESSSDSADLENKLKELGKGMGDTTVSIFLRDMRGIWEKADPKPSPLVREAMKNLGMVDLKAAAEKEKLDLIWLETALLRLGKDFCRKSKCLACPIKKICKNV